MTFFLEVATPSPSNTFLPQSLSEMGSSVIVIISEAIFSPTFPASLERPSLTCFAEKHGQNSLKRSQKLLPLITMLYFPLSIVSAPSFATAIFTAITQGVLCAAATVYTNELITQSQKEE